MLYHSAGYNSQASSYFSAVHGPYYVTSADGVSYDYYLAISAILRFETIDGPFVSGHRIYGYELELTNVPNNIPSEIQIERIYLNFTMSGALETFDVNSSQVISVQIDDIENRIKNEIIPLKERNGYLMVERSGTKQMTMVFKVFHKDQNYAIWEYSENTVYNQIEIESSEAYQKYLHTRIAVVGIVISAITFSIPATFKVIRDIYQNR